MIFIDTLKESSEKDKNDKWEISNLGNVSSYSAFVKELLEEEKNKKEITYKKNYDQYCKFNYMKELGGDGLELIDNKTLEALKSVAAYMVKTAGKGFFNGSSIMRTPLPVYINDERTTLEV